MQIRKLVKSGNASLVVAVPSEWIRSNKLKAGDSVYITEEPNCIKITTDLKPETAEKKEIVINVDGKDVPTIWHEMTAAYMNNYYYIVLKGKEIDKVSREVKRSIAGLVALELVEDSKDKIVARDFVNICDADLKVVIRRMDNIVRSMIIDAKAVTKNQQLVEAITDRDIELNKLSFFVFKILKTAYLDRKMLSCMNITDIDLLRYWELNIHLEKIGDRTKNMAQISKKLNSANKTKYAALLEELQTLYEATMKSFYENSFKEADIVARKRRKLMVEMQGHLNKNGDSAWAQIIINAFNFVSNTNDIARVVMYLDQTQR